VRVSTVCAYTLEVNHGNGQYIIKPSDVLLMKGNEVIDSMLPETLVAVAKKLHARISDKTTRQVKAYFSNLGQVRAGQIPTFGTNLTY
jgi:hypothetical protein